MSKHNAKFNDDRVYPVKSTDNMVMAFGTDSGIVIDETGDGSFFPFDPEGAWTDCDDSAYYAAVAEVMTYVIEVAATVGIYNIDTVKRGMRVEDVIRAYAEAIKEEVWRNGYSEGAGVFIFIISDVRVLRATDARVHRRPGRVAVYRRQ